MCLHCNVETSHNRLENSHERRVEAEELRRGKPLWNHHHTRFSLLILFITQGFSVIIVVITAILIWWHNLQKCWRSWLSGAQNGGASLGATKVQVSPIILILSWHLSRLQLQKLIMALCFIQGRHLKCYSKSKLHIHSGTVALIFEKRPLEGL